MHGLSKTEIDLLRAGEVQVFTLKMAILNPELRERAQNTGDWGEWVLKGAEYVDATFIARTRDALRNLLRKEDRKPASADWNSLQQLPGTEAVNLLQSQRSEIAEMIQRSFSRIVRGETDCERLFGIGM